MDKKKHWENIYQTKELKDVSWYQPIPETSIDLVQKYAVNLDAEIIDMGGGDSFLVDHLLELGYINITVLDISEAAVERAKTRLGSNAQKVTWIISDASQFVPQKKYDLWHDRAAFHFLTDRKDIENYMIALQNGLSENGIAVIGTFSKTGPLKCSGIEIKQYSEESLKEQFSVLKNIESFAIDHTTPFKTVQNFVFGVFSNS